MLERTVAVTQYGLVNLLVFMSLEYLGSHPYVFHGQNPDAILAVRDRDQRLVSVAMKMTLRSASTGGRITRGLP